MKRVLVAYFSASGVTAKAARALAEAENADLFEIRPETPYSPADLDWTDRRSRSSVEMADPECRPAMKETIGDMSRYDTVFVGFPVWWGREPSIVDTFLDSCDLSGKKIIPFCTSGGSDIGKTADRIRGIVGEEADVDQGKRIGGEISAEDLKIWMEGLGL